MLHCTSQPYWNWILLLAHCHVEFITVITDLLYYTVRSHYTSKTRPCSPASTEPKVQNKHLYFLSSTNKHTVPAHGVGERTADPANLPPGAPGMISTLRSFLIYSILRMVCAWGTAGVPCTQSKQNKSNLIRHSHLLQENSPKAFNKGKKKSWLGINASKSA